MARNIIKSIERGGYRYDVEETGDGARPYDVHQLHKAQGHWVDARLRTLLRIHGRGRRLHRRQTA